MERLCVYLSRALHTTLPEPVVEKAKIHTLDTIASMVSGSRLAAGQSAQCFVKSQGGKAEATIIGTSLVTSAANAALANGMQAHADETDDSHPASITHPGCAVVPAALASAESCGRDGGAFLRAVVLGYDICARTVRALEPERLIAAARSTHAIGGIFGAAAAAGALAGLDTERMRYLLAYAVQQSSGTFSWLGDKGHVGKAFDFGGMPARNGTLAAMMVKAGMTAAEDALFAPRGFFDAFGPAADPDAIARGLGDHFEILETNIKRWTVGSPNQAVLDALEKILQSRKLGFAEVADVEIQIPADAVPIVDNRQMPNVCVQHLAALMLVDGTVGFTSSHDEARMTDEAVLAARSRVRLVPSTELEHATPRRQAIVTVRLNSGETLAHRTYAVRGTVDNPMPRDEVEAKARDLMAPVLGKAKAARLIGAISNIEGLQDIRKLKPMLRQAAARRASGRR